MNIDYLYIFASFSLNLLIIETLIPYLRRILMTIPNTRSSHSLPKPSGGGICFVVSTLIAIIISKEFYFLIPIPLAIVGFIDDNHDIKIHYRFFIHTLTSFLLIYYSNFYLINYNFSVGSILLIYLLLTILSIGIINVVNFMDGIDGLVTGTSIVFIVSSILYIKYDSLLIICGSLIAFLFYNWFPSKVFMGDIGSTFIGALYVGLLLHTSNIDETISLFLISSPLLLDGFTCIIRRYLHKQEIFNAHKLHLYQRLNQAGWSHSKVSIIYILATLSLSIAYLTGGLLVEIILFLIIISYGLYLDQNVARRFVDCL